MLTLRRVSLLDGAPLSVTYVATSLPRRGLVHRNAKIPGRVHRLGAPENIAFTMYGVNSCRKHGLAFSERLSHCGSVTFW